MRERGRRKPPRPSLPTSSAYLLDRYSVEDVRRAREFAKNLLAFHWKHYTELAFQRYEARDVLRGALLEAACDGFTFKGWQRVVPWQWSLVPLSSAGSLNDPGGRFNFGAIDPRFAAFPALYLAQNKETGLQEVLGQAPGHVTKQGRAELTATDLALKKHDSVSFISVSGHLESYIDLGQPRRLTRLIDILRHFTLSNDLAKMAKALGLPPPTVITRLDQLMNELLRPDWRAYPAQVDVPSNSQLFGQLVLDAGIDAIVFPSRFNRNSCLALYPSLLSDSDSFAELDDPKPSPPNPKVIRRLDRHSWPQLVQ